MYVERTNMSHRNYNKQRKPECVGESSFNCCQLFDTYVSQCVFLGINITVFQQICTFIRLLVDKTLYQL